MVKDIYKLEKNDLTYGRGYVYSLQYHIVWCTKYRKQVLKDGLDEDIKEMLCKLAEDYSFTILAMEVMPDHIHLLLDCKPQFMISDMVKILKSNTACSQRCLPTCGGLPSSLPWECSLPIIQGFPCGKKKMEKPAQTA